MKIIRSNLFNSLQQIAFGLSTRVPSSDNDPYGFNLSLSIGDDKERVIRNRELFYNKIGFTSEQVAYQYQVHGDRVKIADSSGFVGENDAMITSRKNIGLAITTADCAAVFIYDGLNEVIAGVHSGWRGTVKNILGKTLQILVQEFNSKPEDLLVYIAPSISQSNYEVGEEVAVHFDQKYKKEYNNKFLLDVASVNFDILLMHGIPEDQIEKSPLCSYNSTFLHSYRRDGDRSGRALAVIAMKEIK